MRKPYVSKRTRDTISHLKKLGLDDDTIQGILNAKITCKDCGIVKASKYMHKHGYGETIHFKCLRCALKETWRIINNYRSRA